MVRGLPGAMVEIPLGVKIGTAAEATVSPDKVIIAASNGNITVRTSSDYIREIEVYSISGQLIYHQRISGQTLNAAVPAQSFARGIYIVKTTTARGTFSGKIIL